MGGRIDALRRTFAPSGFRGRLLLILIAVSTLPLLVTAGAFFTILNNNIQAETFSRLAFVRDAKRSEILQYLGFATRQAESLIHSNAVRYSIGDFYGFSYAFRKIDPVPERATAILQQLFRVDGAGGERRLPADDDALIRSALEYSNAHTQFHDDFAAFINSAEFDNLYLINADDRVVYSVEKDRYLGRDLKGTMIGTEMADALAALERSPKTTTTIIRDFTRDSVTGVFAAYVATRVDFYGKQRGVVVFRLPAAGLARLVQGQGDVKSSIYLLNAANQFISSPAGSRNAQASMGREVRQTAAIHTALIEKGLEGTPVLSAWSPLHYLDVTWLLVTEVPTAVALADSEALRRFVSILAVFLLPILFFIVLSLSRTMTRPLQKLTDAAETIAAGDLDRTMPFISRPSEFGRLSASFLRMRDAIREQLSLIGQKNAELEKQVALVEEKNAALEAADQLKDAFLANTSHELRTPLNGIIGISETLSAGAAGELTAPQRSQLNLITFSARRLSRLVDDLLDLYRIRNNRVRLDVHPVHVPTSLRNVMQLSEPLLRGEPVALSVDLPETLPFVMADPVRFEQILYNLIGNAIKYTDRGAIHIFARECDGQIAIMVEDTGRGIAPDNLERMFEPLEQVDAIDTDRKRLGAGLGLSIARQLATMMGGALTAESTPGVGSRFTVTLPAAPIETEMPVLADHEEAEAWVPSANLSWPEIDSHAVGDGDAPLILVVDDEPINIQVLRNVLLPRGYAVRSAESGAAALALIERRRPDLVVLDVMMPEMSGLEVAQRLRERFSLHDLPIIMVTARSRTRDVIAGFEAGANDYVIKPFVKDELLARVATLLEAGRARGRARENSELRAEIARRVQVEDSLRLSQHRMAGLLDTIETGLICVNDLGLVTYANEAARRALGQPISVGQTGIGDLFDQDVFASMAQLLDAEGGTAGIRLGEKNLHLHGFPLDADAGGGFAVVLTEAEDPDALIRSVKGVVDSVGASLVGEERGPSASIDDYLSDHTLPAEREAYRQAIVELMTLSLSLWRRATGESKIAFAERSGIWRVNLDRSSLQARTLDKYLLIETLPLNPRWRDVVQTAEFVLSDIEGNDMPGLDAERATLRRKLAALRSFVRDKLLPPRGEVAVEGEA